MGVARLALALVIATAWSPLARAFDPAPLEGVLASLRRSEQRSAMPVAGQTALADLVVLSDLHLGEGRIGRAWSPYEQFRSHQEVGELIDYLLRRQARAGNRPLKLVLDGDIFDFLAVSRPARHQAWIDHDLRRDHSPMRWDARTKLDRIAEQHRPVFDAFARVLAAGHELVVIPGNHDQELHFPEVQKELARLLGLRRGPQAWRRPSKLRFEPWFHLHGDVLVEHGHRYDPINNIAFMLYPFDRADQRTRRLRPASGTYFVTEFLRQLPAALQPKSRSGIWRALQALPPELGRFAGFGARMADRAAPLDRDFETLLGGRHNAVLRSHARQPELRAALAQSRQRMGLAPLDRAETKRLLQVFDAQAATPYLRRHQSPERSTWRQKLAMLSPPAVWGWLFHRWGDSTLQRGQEQVLTEMANVMVTGHTHKAYHFQLNSEHGAQHLLNSGSWTKPGAKGDGLTFVDIRQTGPATKVRLRHWSNERTKPISRRAKVLPPGRSPRKMQVHRWGL